MRNGFFCFLIVLLLSCFCSPAFGAAVGGTNPVVDGSLVALAFECDHIYDRDLKASNASNASISEQNTIYGKLTFKTNEYFNLYVKAGAATFRTKADLDNGSVLREEYDPGIYAGIGAKVLYEFVPRVTLAIDNQFNWWRSDVGDIVYDEVSAADESGHRTCWEYQLSGVLSYKIDYKKLFSPIQGEWPVFTPYVGIKYAHLKIDSIPSATSGGTQIPMPDDYSNKYSAGLIFGLDTTLQSLGGFSFNIEGRIFDETALSGYVQYNF